MRLTVDRIEDGFAVCETAEGSVLLNRSELPEGASEGDILEKTPSGYVLLKEETARRRKRISEKIRRLAGE